MQVAVLTLLRLKVSSAMSQDKLGIKITIFFISPEKTYVVGTHWKRLIETLPMSTTANVFMED